jgi:periplasmic divalent cation tolerance protein
MRNRRRPIVSDGIRLVITTAPDATVAGTLVRALVDERLAACGNILDGIRSIYRWQGGVEEQGEVLVVLKTSAARADAVVDRIGVLHPYEVPEALVVDVAGVLPAYMKWVHESTQEVDEG